MQVLYAGKKKGWGLFASAHIECGSFIVEYMGEVRVLQCVAVCCSVLQCVAVCCSVLQCAAVCCVLQCVAVCCSVMKCAVVCCSTLQSVQPTFVNEDILH